MTRCGIMRSVGLLFLAVVVGCGKASDEGATATSASTGASTQTAVATAAKETPAASGVVQTSAVMPAVQGDPIVVLHTTLGNMYVQLYERQAPRTVANFLDYARVGHYDGTLFHQVESGFVALGGAYGPDLKAKPVRYPVVNEAMNGLKNLRGTLAMVRDPSDPNSATSMFFVNLGDNAKLDHQGSTPELYGFCVFGRVIDGFDVLDKLSAVKTSQVEGFTNLPSEHITLNSVRLVSGTIAKLGDNESLPPTLTQAPGQGR